MTGRRICLLRRDRAPARLAATAAKESLPDTGARSVNCYQARCRDIWDICTEPRILDLIEDVVGPGIVCRALHFFCKMQHDPKAVPQHQDATHWHLTPARTVTVRLAIDDADEDNSAMRCIPGTHDKGHLQFRGAGEGAVLRFETVGAEALAASPPSKGRRRLACKLPARYRWQLSPSAKRVWPRPRCRPPNLMCRRRSGRRARPAADAAAARGRAVRP
ncbi:hypothetical protein DEA8626_01078 [Defluviimonas aquaemixtae]|uniref:Phytanoyl-CoA dioxygenase family protein n=1 Tax=Albidovulum aquaemixtae TaxID=1542388 RepID=A0A2R8B4L2_9RHOB|nr:phytanoyl-CoA dioxygenase family protein [Defluviimonas aquaemixtae]SPH17555.1 hypothetical protein DEA8626_01078 [Defluviimonas aquaemixtae]